MPVVPHVPETVMPPVRSPVAPGDVESVWRPVQATAMMAATMAMDTEGTASLSVWLMSRRTRTLARGSHPWRTPDSLSVPDPLHARFPSLRRARAPHVPRLRTAARCAELRRIALPGDAMAHDRAVPRQPHEGGHGRAVAAEHVLHRRRERWRVEDDRLRPHLGSDLRRTGHRVRWRDRGRLVGSECRLRRERRGPAAPRPLDR